MIAGLPHLPASAVVVFGDVMEDIIVRPSGPIVKGSDRPASISSHAGGSGANQAVWLAASGEPVRFVARVGAEDKLRLDAAFAAQGVTPFLVADRDRATGRLITVIDPDGERSFLTDRGANLECSPSDLAAGLLDGVGLVVISGYAFFSPNPRKTAMALMVAAAQKSIPVVVDAASEGFLRETGRDAFLKSCAGAFGLFANSDEAAFLSDANLPEAQVEALRQHFPLVVVKAGSAGAFAQIEGGVLVHGSALEAEVVDTTGAGDAFLSGFVHAWRQGENLEAALRQGNRRGAEAVGIVGGRPPHAT